MQFTVPITKTNEYDLEREKQALNSNLDIYVRSITAPSKNKGFYICPLCKSGTGKHGTGAFKLYTDDKGVRRWKCFSCDKGGNIFDLIGEIEGKAEFAEQINRARELFPTSSLQAQNKPQTAPQAQAPEAKKQKDYTKLYQEWNSHLNETTYHRGISLETLNRFNVGYCKEWKHPDSPNSIPSERLIIPLSKDSYTARAIDPDNGVKYMKVAGDVRHFLNERALTAATQPICIVEGEIDALSIIDVGGEAIGLGSVSNIPYFLSLLDSNRPVQPLVVSLDNDPTGEEQKAKLIEGLETRDIPYRELGLNMANGCKDANDYLTKYREILENKIAELSDITRQEYINTSSIKGYMTEYRQQFSNPDYGKAYPTGYKLLDEVLNGGLREGLTVIGALSGLGKTTVLLQIANYIASQGQDVIYFSLEMNKAELTTRTISRLSYQIPKQRGESALYSKSLIQIYAGRREWGEKTKALMCECLDYYESYSEHLYIVDGIGEITLEKIRKTVEKHKQCTGTAPLVFVDYLQIITPEKDRNSDKANTDNAVVGLKKISSSYHIPVITLSSFNRENYNNYVTMASFKESGGIEYTADVLIGMQCSTAGTPAYNYFAEIGKPKDQPLYIDMLLLKYRQGSTRYGVEFVFQREYGCFEEISKVEKNYELMNKAASGQGNKKK